MEHEMEMTGSGGMDDMSGDTNAISVPSGETVDLTWTFSKQGRIIVGCHTQATTTPAFSPTSESPPTDR